MGAQRDADGFAAAHSDGNPEVIDVARDPVGFRGESDWHACHVHKLSMAQLKVPVLAALAVSMWQSEIEYACQYLSSGESHLVRRSLSGRRAGDP